MKNQENFEREVRIAKSDNSIEDKRQRVLKKYGEMLQPRNIHSLDIEKFSSFLNYSENEHWTGLNQNVPLLTSDLTRLKEALTTLLDETGPIEDRIDKVTGESGEPMVKGLGPARISAILQVAYPARYGVYNRVSMDGLTMIGMNPADSTTSWGSMTLGEQYTMVNDVLLNLSKEYKITLWAMDWVWFALLNPEEVKSTQTGDVDSKVEAQPGQRENALENEINESRFSLESHLEDFLVVNWNNTTLSKRLELEVLTDRETGETIGKQYRTDAGKRIDLLCKNKKTGGYTVIELKRDKPSYSVVGQTQRYMGWVVRNMASGKPVDGIIICKEVDDDLKDALLVAPNIQYFTYEVSFNLKGKEDSQ